VHVSQGVACVECHGRIDQMPLTKLNQPLQMKWCLECHNDPYPNLRPAEQMFDFAQWESVSKESWFVPNETYHINVSQLDNCSVCHYSRVKRMNRRAVTNDRLTQSLRQAKGPELWRSLDELSQSPEFLESFHREFPSGASEWHDDVSRRTFLKMMAASFA